MATPYTVKEREYIRLEDILGGMTPQSVMAAMKPYVAKDPKGKFIVDYNWDDVSIYFVYERPMTDKEINEEKKKQAKIRKANAAAKIKKEEQERKQLARLKAKYEG